MNEIKTRKLNKKVTGKTKYVSIFFMLGQVNGSIAVKKFAWDTLGFPSGCYNLSDIHFYTDHDLLSIEKHWSKYYDNINIDTFDEFLNFISEANGWEIFNITPIIKDGNTQQLLYTFVKDD